MSHNIFNINADIRLRDVIPTFADDLYYSIFEQGEQKQNLLIKLGGQFNKILLGLNILDSIEWKDFITLLPQIEEQLYKDAVAFRDGDPANKSLEEIYLAYPGFYAVAIYRMSHELLKLGVPILPRMLTEYAHSKTGADIHPGAQIGESFFIDHATGVVIGETAVIKDRVKVYQGVTLGGLRIDKSHANSKRHPSIESDVTIYANATILGGSITIGENSTIGANVWIKDSVPPNSVLTFETNVNIREKSYA